MLSILEENICLRVFKDSDSANGYPEIMHCNHISESECWLKEQNANGMGCYFTVNGTDGKGAKLENITEVRAWYAEIDGMPNEKQKRYTIHKVLKSPLPPSAVVKSKNGIHMYWYAKPNQIVNREEFATTLSGIIKFYKADEAIKDLPRVLRLPKYLHRKNPQDPYLINVAYEKPDLIYEQQQIREAYKPPVAKPKQQYKPNLNTQGEGWTPEKIVDRMIVKGNMNHGRNHLGYRIAYALSCNDVPLNEAKALLLREYQPLANSYKSDSYTAEECVNSIRSAYSAPKGDAWV